MARSSFAPPAAEPQQTRPLPRVPALLFEDVVRRNPRPSGPSFALNIAVDGLFRA